MNVAIVGASDKDDRFSNKAMKALLKNGHSVFLVHPTLKSIDSHPVHRALGDILVTIHTITMYVNERLSTELEMPILKIKPKRVIFNPGTENRILEETLVKHKIDVVEDCTLIMLREDLF